MELFVWLLWSLCGAFCSLSVKVVLLLLLLRVHQLEDVLFGGPGLAGLWKVVTL